MPGLRAVRLPAADVVARTLLDQWRSLVVSVDGLDEAVLAAPTRLPGWRVADLVAHVVGTVDGPRRLLAGGTVAHPVGRSGASRGGGLLTAAGYYDDSAGRAARIAEDARERAAAGDPQRLPALLATTVAAAGPIVTTTPPETIVTADPGPIRLGDYLVTRVVEAVVHALDLAAAVAPDHGPAVEQSALGITVRLLVARLAARAPGRSVEVRVPPFAAVQAVEGPRHTRGTPPNTVEAEPLAWVELATGRLDWAAAVADGRVRASGSRADLSPYLPVLA